MVYRWNRIAQFAVLGTACSFAVWMGSTSAEESSVLVKKPAAQADAAPALPPPANPNEPAANAAPNKSGDVFAPSTPAAPKLLPVPPQSQPQPQSNTTVKRPFMRPAEPREPARGKLVGAEPIPTPPGGAPIVQDPNVPNVVAPPAAGSVNVKPTPPIDYDTDHDARKMYRAGSVNIAVLTKDPTDGCMYQIPLCIPACCVGEPKVSGGVGLLGRGKVEYCWPCGFRAIVSFRHSHGDIKVKYEGD